MGRAFGICWRIGLGAAVLLGLYLTSLVSYLLFHTLTELVAIAVATSAFVMAWTGRGLYSNSYLFVVGIGFGFVAIPEVLHTLAYQGLGVFPGQTANLPTQLWIASRALLTLTLLTAPLLLGRKVRVSLLFGVYFIVTTGLLLSIFVWPVFPEAYASGLTPFKIIAEYVMSVLLLLGLALLWTRREHFDARVMRTLAAAVALTVASELAFTSYVSVYGRANLVGHLLMVASFYCFYLAIVRTAFADPLHVLFQDRERLLATERGRAELAENLNREIGHRVKNNLAMMAGLLQLQMAQQKDARISEALGETISRLMTFASLHEEMQAGPGASLDLLPILRRIAVASGEAFTGRRVTASVLGEPVLLPAQAAMNFAVIGNELITNAIKHGAPAADGILRVEVEMRQNREQVLLQVRNSGHPLPAGFDLLAQKGMGLQLVTGLAEQYQASFSLRPEANGNLAQLIAPWSEVH